VTLCSFSPCIEQAQRAIACLRALGWARVGMSELRQRFIVVRRERVGLQEEGLRGVCAAPADVDEAVARLRELERKNEDFASARRGGGGSGGAGDGNGEAVEEGGEGAGGSRWSHVQSRQDRLRGIQEAFKSRKIYKEGRLVHRTEPDMKTHTSYLVFAVLPREWSEEDEAAAEARLAPGG
jgi:tRNA (adenine57-N1/adenine58-N1)-methyltransferase catalytic subunit